MDKVIIELTGDNSLKALKELENRKLIRILRNPKQDSYALAGEPISEVDFKNWIEYAENTPTLSLNEAKQQWSSQKRKLQDTIR
jgi:predicted ATP-grasp superfamily ATP-dependent carboligase